MNNTGRITFFHRLLIFQAVVATFFLRPFAFGAEYPMVGLWLLILSSILLSITLPRDNNNITKETTLIFFFYLLDTIIIFVTGAGGETAFTKFGYVILGALLFSNKKVMSTYFKYLKFIFLILIIFALINFVLGSIYTEKQLLIKDITLGTYDFSIYKPLAITSGNWSIESAALSMFAGIHIRNNFFLIEPGMVPPFFTALIFLIYDSPYEKHKIAQITTLILGILLSFSTSGPLILLASGAAYYFFKSYQNKKLSIKKVVVVLLLLILAFVAFEYMPSFGRQAKSELSNAQAASMEAHQNVALYVQIGFIINALCVYVCTRKKVNYALYITIGIALCIGYLSNYIGFTFIFTAFLLWGENKGINNKTINVINNNHG